MCINMPKTIKEERLRWILPIYNKEIKAGANLTPISKNFFLISFWIFSFSQNPILLKQLHQPPKQTKF